MYQINIWYNPLLSCAKRFLCSAKSAYQGAEDLFLFFKYPKHTKIGSKRPTFKYKFYTLNLILYYVLVLPYINRIARILSATINFGASFVTKQSKTFNIA